MKNFIQNLLRRKEIAAPFWRDSSARIVLRPPVPKCLVIARQGDTITVTETHVSLFGWLTSPSPDDVEMQFHIDDSGGWTPRYLKHGTEPARRFYDNEDGAGSWNHSGCLFRTWTLRKGSFPRGICRGELLSFATKFLIELSPVDGF
ncbi:MAG: hypothetical protein KF802_07850 [Bdellovibrionaceae bacterium]|nr:hypothetical protein [Pseudobdellovibrionaceae bacterium]